MMGDQVVPTSFQSNGERIYFTGASASGRPITFSGGNMHIQMHGGGCVTCHDVDRRGGIRVMPRFWIVAPPITPKALFGDHDEEAGAHGDHQAYTVASLRRAITEGMDPSGKRLDTAMPRWSMNEQDLADLVRYLQGSKGQAHADAPSEGDPEHDDTHQLGPFSSSDTVVGGVSVPTGSIDRKDDTPAGPDQVLPYPMQIGSGTYDLLLGITYTGRRSDYSWGAQFGATARLGENDRDYTLSNIYQISVWGARKWTNKLSSSIRLQGESEENIDGADPRLNPLQVPTADSDLRGGERINLGLGLNFLVPSGWFAGTNLALEVVVSISQDLDGPQVERDSVISVGLRKPF